MGLNATEMKIDLVPLRDDDRERFIHFYVNRLGFQIVAYYHSRFPDPDPRYVASDDDAGMFRFEKQICCAALER